MPAPRFQMELVSRVSAHAMQAMQVLRRLPLRPLLQQPMLRDPCPANSKWRSWAEWVLMQCGLCRHSVACHDGPFCSDPCSEMTALRTQMAILCRAGAHALQAGQALRRQSLRSYLRQPLLRRGCPRTQMELMCRAGARVRQAMQVLRRLSLRSFPRQPMPRDPCPANSKRKACAKWVLVQMQAMQALRRLPRRSFLQRLMPRDACPVNLIEEHSPSRCSCTAG